MSKKLLWVLAILGLATPAWGQANFGLPPPGGVVVIGAQVVANCGVGTLNTATPGFITIDQTGKLCTNASLSGTSIGSVTQGTIPWVTSISANGATATVKNGNVILTTDPALAVSDPNVLGAINSSQPAGTNRIGYVSDDPCTQLVKITSPISLTSSNIMIAALSGTTKPTVCSIVLISDTAAKASLVEGVGNGCTTGATGVIGGVSATLSGMSFAANGGITLGNGGGTVAAAKTAGNALCIWQSAAQLISGSISLVYAP